MKTPSFIEKDKKGKRKYSNSLKRYRCYIYLNTDLGKKSRRNRKLTER